MLKEASSEVSLGFCGMFFGFLGSGSVGDDDLWYHFIWGNASFILSFKGFESESGLRSFGGLFEGSFGGGTKSGLTSLGVCSV